MHHFAVHCEALHLPMREVQDAAAGSLVNAATLHADKAILDHVHAPATVATAEGVEDFHHPKRGEFSVVVGIEFQLALVAERIEEGCDFVVADRCAVALLEREFDMFSLVWSFLRRDGEDIHVARFFGGGVEPRVFENAGFERNVEKVAVHRIWLFHRCVDWDVVFLRVCDHLGAAGEFLAETVLPPRGNDFQRRSQCGGCEFKADLVISFSRRAVGDRVCAFRLGYLDHFLGDTRTGDARAEEILTFVDCSSLHHREDEIAGELLAKIFDEALARSGFERLRVEPIEFLFLADVGAEGDDFSGVCFFQPSEQDARVETTGIS